MATYTSKYNLKKPDLTDFVDVADLNDNADLIDAALDGKAASDHTHSNYILTSQKAVANGVASLGADGKVPDAQLPDGLKTFALNITFHPSMKGKAFTVTGTGLTTYNGTVPDSLAATVAVPNANTTYTATCDGKSKAITVGSYYGIYYGYLDIVSTVLAENSWAQIAAVSAAGNAEKYWSVGDEIDIEVDGETLTLQIYGFNHDDLTGGGKAGITFGMKNLMATTRRMEATNTNANGFTGSEMYDWLQNTLLPSLPAELQSCIKAVDKKTSAGNKSTDINTDSMKLFLFSVIENGLRTTTDVYKDEGETYPIFTDNASRIKYLSNGSGSAYYWWERSPHASSTTSFCAVGSNGDAVSSSASSSYGICFGFCV